MLCKVTIIQMLCKLNKPHSENNAITTNGNNDSNGLRGGHGFDPDGGHG